MEPPANLVALLQHYTCGHCANPTPPTLDADDNGIWHIVLLHDQTCPVYLGTVETAPNIARAYQAEAGQKE